MQRRGADRARRGVGTRLAIRGVYVVVAALRLRVLLLVPALVSAGACAQFARAGGTPIGFVSLPQRATLAVVDLPTGGAVARIRVAAGAAAVAAAMNGRRVLVTSPSAGAVTEIDGVHDRVVRVFRGLDRPVAVAFAYEPPVGIVTPRYAFVLEQRRGTLVVLDLVRGRIACRLHVGPRPENLAVDGATVWITHAGGTTLTRVDVTMPTKPRLLPSVEEDGKVIALVADPNLRSVFVADRRAGKVARYVDGDRRAACLLRPCFARGAHGARRRRAEPADRRRPPRRADLHARDDRQGAVAAAGAAETRSLAAYGGWLVAILPRGLSLVGTPNGSMRSSVPFASRIGGFAWSVR